MIYLLFFIGAMFGSFYLVLALRLPINEKVVLSRSHCDNCKSILKPIQLIPIFSYFLYKGKCPECGKRIPLINLIIEIISGLGFVLLYLKYGFSYEYYYILVIFSLVLIIFVSDFKYLIINDSPIIGASLLIIILKICYFGIKDTIFSIVSGIILFLVMYLIKLLGDYLFKKESLGGGDIKLSFFIGLCLGFRLGLFSLILSAFLALPASVFILMLKQKKELPFGPFLIGSVFIIYLFLDKFNVLINFIFNIF